MCDNLLDPSNAVQLSRALNLQLFILFQHAKAKKGLKSTENGRRTILETSKLIQDCLLANHDENDLSSIKYNDTPCSRKKWEKQKISDTEILTLLIRGPLSSPENWFTKYKKTGSPDSKEKPSMKFKRVRTGGLGAVLNQAFATYFFMFVILCNFISDKNSVTMDHCVQVKEFTMQLKRSICVIQRNSVTLLL